MNERRVRVWSKAGIIVISKEGLAQWLRFSVYFVKFTSFIAYQNNKYQVIKVHYNLYKAFCSYQLLFLLI